MRNGVSDGDGDEEGMGGGCDEGEVKRVGVEDENGFNREEKKSSLKPSSVVDKKGVVKECEVALKHLGFSFFTSFSWSSME